MLPRSIGSLQLDTVDVAGSNLGPVLCLHGLFAGSWVFEKLLPMIAERGHPAAALSFRGHPRSAPVASLGQCSIRDYCDDASKAARALGRPIVIGHSLGGLVALLLAARNYARAAILVAPAPPRGISVLSPPVLLRMASYLPALAFSRPFLPSNAHLDALVLNRVPEADRPALRDRLVPDSGKAARQAAIGLFKVPPRALRTAMLIVSGDQDRFIPLGVSRKVANKYGVPLHVAHGHGHFLFGEPGWESTAAAMLDWIDTLPRVLREPDSAPFGGSRQTGR
ncbi:MAG: alpha/beta hydrolase [Gemmatimonadaceae bacterium]|nr:alpha/beta hydrolase [Gemmatimonadaceae bacterium]